MMQFQLQSQQYDSEGSQSSYSLSSSCNSTNSSVSYCMQNDDINIEFMNLNLQKASIDVNMLQDDRVLQNLLFTEENYCINTNYFETMQTEIKPWMRQTLASWMLEVCENQDCSEDVLVLAMNILDRFLSIQQIGKRHLQLLGTVCLFIASKVRCAVPLSAETLVVYTDNSIVLEELLNWEQYVLQKLRWDISSVLANDFVPHLIEKLGLNETRHTDLIKQHISSFIALSSTDFRFSVFNSSLIASGCILTAIDYIGLSVNDSLFEQLQKYTFINRECLQECYQQISDLVEVNYNSEKYEN